MSRTFSNGALRKSPAGKDIVEGLDVRGFLPGVEVGDPRGGVMFFTGSVAAAAGPLVLSFLEASVEGVGEAGWKYPLREFILKPHLGR